MRMPPELMQRAMDVVYGGQWSPPPVRAAATCVLLRDGEQGIEVALMRKELGFAKGMFVFPGGAVDADDALLGDPWEVAAIRETFEECGVLLSDPPPTSDVSGLRDQPFSAVLDMLGVRPAVGDLHLFAHWVTPEVESRRFDTRFYAAALPANQELGDLSAEHSEVGWYLPADALALTVLPPTAAALAEVSRFSDVAAALSAPRDVVPLMPTPVADGEGGISWVLVNFATGEPLA